MIPKGKTIYRCVVCKQPVKHLHEIFFGKFRKKSIELNIQAPVCSCSHPHKIHFVAKSKWWAKKLCELMGIKYQKTKLALEVRDTEYLIKIQIKLAKTLKNLEIT